MFKTLMRTECIWCSLVALGALPAHAQSLTGNVGLASVSSGESAVEVRFGFGENGSAAARVHYQYAFTDWYQLRVIGSFS